MGVCYRLHFIDRATCRGKKLIFFKHLNLDAQNWWTTETCFPEGLSPHNSNWSQWELQLYGISKKENQVLSAPKLNTPNISGVCCICRGMWFGQGQTRSPHPLSLCFSQKVILLWCTLSAMITFDKLVLKDWTSWSSTIQLHLYAVIQEALKGPDHFPIIYEECQEQACAHDTNQGFCLR